MRSWSLCVAAGLVAGLVGCVSPERHRELEFRLDKAERERKAWRQLLNAEQAKTAVLNERLTTARREGTSAQAKISSLNERVGALERVKAQYDQLLEQRTSEPLKRPEVRVSPLPPDLDQALQQWAAKFHRRVWYERGRGAVSFANDQLFEPGSDLVRADAHAALHELAGILAATEPEQFEIVVVGHTDNTPITKDQTKTRHPTNWHLSVHRAITVKDVLRQAGLPAKRLGVMGYGPYRPISDDGSRNRRVEIFLVRKGEVQSLAPLRLPRQ